jgi:signal transduction histidine kinase
VITPGASQPSRVAGFRLKLLVSMMLVVSVVTAFGLYFAERNLTAGVERDLQREFQGELDARQRVEAVRYAAFAERCRALMRRSRIQSALEDNALDLLYPNAEDELHDIMEGADESRADAMAPALHAKFYRFLDRTGAVIVPPQKKTPVVGELRPEEEARLALPAVPARQQIGFLARKSADGAEAMAEIIAMPIVSTQTNEVIAALVLGFKPFEFAASRTDAGITSSLWFDGRLHLAGLHADVLAAEVARAIVVPDGAETPLRVSLDGVPHLLFCKKLNPDSRFAPAYEVCVYPLTGLRVRQWQLRRQVIGTGTLLLLGGLLASQFLSRRLSEPVEKLAVDSERSARFSADASHQLKTPVTVLRAGLEELLSHDKLTLEECDAVSALIHQTYRLSSVIEDLLLLSRMDAGRLKIEFSAVNLTQLIEASLDDLGALGDELALAVETDFPGGLHIAGEKRFVTLILQNLLENARKYNRAGGRIRIAVREEAGWVVLAIANTGRPIPAAAQAHIFERFHRGAMGENVPGYGLGLNLARELARLHQGDLHLARSDENWTEFEVRFRPATPTFGAGVAPT